MLAALHLPSPSRRAPEALALARSLDETVSEAWQCRHAAWTATTALNDVRTRTCVRASSAELAALAGDLREAGDVDPETLRACRELLGDGFASPLYGGDAEALRRAAGRLRFLLARDSADRAAGAPRADCRARRAPRRARSVARTLERLAAAAEDGARRPRRLRPPRSVLEIAPEAAGIRELVTLLREHSTPPDAVLAGCEHFADSCWNGTLHNLDREYHRRELGRLRYLLLC